MGVITRHRLYVAGLFLLLVALFSGVFTRADAASTATAPQPAGWGEWLIPTGTLCVQTQGSAVVAQAAANWNRSDAVIVAHSTCAGYPRNMTVVLVGVNQPATATWAACAWTGSASGWTRRTVRGVSILTPNAPTIWVNYAANLRSRCRASTAMWAHLYNHELGHVLGLAHNADASVLAGVGTRYYWAYNAPTALDLARVNRRY